jgi:hypothetical protein
VASLPAEPQSRHVPSLTGKVRPHAVSTEQSAPPLLPIEEHSRQSRLRGLYRLCLESGRAEGGPGVNAKGINEFEMLVLGKAFPPVRDPGQRTGEVREWELGYLVIITIYGHMCYN